MPYKRYDLVNKYDSRGRKRNQSALLSTILLIILPIVILGIIALGIFISYQISVGGNDDVITPTHDESPVIDEEELLRVVNEKYPVDADFEPKLCPFGGVAVSTYTFADLDKMVSDAASEGIILTVSEGYVSYSDQERLHKETYDKIKKEQKCSDIKAESEAGKVCPKAGCSESQTGLLIKLDTDEANFSGSKAQRFLERYAVNYGFVLRYPEEAEADTGMTYNPQLYRYVGPEHALNMRRYGMTLEEYSAHVSMK